MWDSVGFSGLVFFRNEFRGDHGSMKILQSRAKHVLLHVFINYHCMFISRIGFHLDVHLEFHGMYFIHWQCLLCSSAKIYCSCFFSVFSCGFRFVICSCSCSFGFPYFLIVVFMFSNWILVSFAFIYIFMLCFFLVGSYFSCLCSRCQMCSLFTCSPPVR